MILFLRFKIELKQTIIEHNVFITSLWQKDIAEILAKLNPKAPKLLFIIDDKLTVNLDNIVEEYLVLKVDVLESSKSFDLLSRLSLESEEFGLDRSSVIITIGGGVIGDLGGFLASVYKRGIRWINIPTTLLAQVDSSVGGKTGINSRLAKNAIGTFWFPEFTIIDPSFLKTLSLREINSGIAEIIKYGVISDKEILDELEELKPDVSSLIEKSVLIKRRFVEIDPFDNGERRILNLGHTLGHALESFYSFNGLTHGEGVAIGILVSLYVSNKKYGFSFESLIRIYNLFLRFGLFKRITLPEPKFIGELIEKDKKREGTIIKEIFLKSIGEPIIVENSIDEWIRDYSDFLIAFSRLRGNLMIAPSETFSLPNHP